MDYFRIIKDYENFPKVFAQGLISLQKYNLILNGHTYLIPNAISLSASTPKSEGYTDILTEQIFMVNEKIFHMLRLFDENMDYRFIFLSNDEISYSYYIPILPLVDCYSSQSKSNSDKSVVKSLVINQQKYFPDIFRIADIKDNITIVSKMVMDAMLMRDPVGIKLQKIEFEGEVS